MGTDAGSRPEISGDAKMLRPGCAQAGCGVRPEMASYRGPDGRRWCISHNPDPGPKQTAARNGGDVAGAVKRRKKTRYMPASTQNPDWSTPKALRAWLEDRAGRVERGELDLPAVPVKLAEIARATHNDEALEKLDGLEALIKNRLLGGT